MHISLTKYIHIDQRLHTPSQAIHPHISITNILINLPLHHSHITQTHTGPPSPPSLAQRRPPPNKPMPLPRGQQTFSRGQKTLPPNINQNIPPRNKKRPATPVNKMAETPQELGTIQQGKHRPPHHLPLLESSYNIQGRLEPAVYSETETPISAPPQRISGQKYSALSADAEVNEYASLKPVAKQRIAKLRERAKKKLSRKLQIENRESESERKDSYNVNTYETGKPVHTENLTDNSRVVCILLSIIVVCLLLAIGSLITAVYTITAFEKYKSSAIIKTRAVNECRMNLQNWKNHSFEETVEQRCEYRATNETNSQVSNSETMHVQIHTVTHSYISTYRYVQK